MFALSKILWTLVAPGNLLLELLLVGTALQCFGGAAARRRAAGRFLILVATTAALAIAVLPVGDAAVSTLEDRFSRPGTLPERIDGIIVLGAAIDAGISEARGEVALNSQAERLTTAARLARAHPEAKLLFSGGSGLLLGDEPPEAPWAARFLGELGLDPARLLLEGRSRNTYENAVESKAIVAPRAGEQWLLVTSAWHMPRAVGVFRKAGWDVIPYPVAYKTTGLGEARLGFDLSDGLDKLACAEREWLGLVAYYLLGRSSALFPAP